MIVRLAHALQSTPPYGLSGLRELFASERTSVIVPRATPGNLFPQCAQLGLAFLLLL